jgi:hypothetical protein
MINPINLRTLENDNRHIYSLCWKEFAGNQTLTNAYTVHGLRIITTLQLGPLEYIRETVIFASFYETEEDNAEASEHNDEDAFEFTLSDMYFTAPLRVTCS